ncbi:hypothetical protein ACFJIY_07095 [Pimelobacter simplex]|uniref:hypothetical protein n=1 Tax=Nocardioides simplex TaxID=2045 RepID=UPI003670F36A
MSASTSLPARLRAGVLLVLVPLVASIAVVLVLGPPADAKVRKWNSLETPLTAYDNGKAKASGYGTWQIGTTVNGTRSQAYGYLRDRDTTNDNAVYFELFTQTNAGTCLAPEYTSCSASYFTYASQFSDFDKETWRKGTWSPRFYASTALNPSGSYARALMQVSESNSGPDSHSKNTFTKGNPY